MYLSRSRLGHTNEVMQLHVTALFVILSRPHTATDVIFICSFLHTKTETGIKLRAGGSSSTVVFEFELWC